MNSHPADEQIVDYLDGTLPPPAERGVEQHLSACGDCRHRLSDLAQFDDFVQSHQPGDEVTTAAMFAVSERVLDSARGTQRRGTRWGGVVTLLAAAMLLVSGAFWLMAGSDAEGLGLRITRYVPDGAMRSMPPERFHLDVLLEREGYVAVFARFADGKVVQLLPAGPAAPSPRGAVRLPANELLDWEYPADRLPHSVLVVQCALLPDALALDELKVSWAGIAADQLPAGALVAGRRAQLLPFPPSR